MSIKKTPSDFQFGSEIGQGSYSIVIKAIESSSQKEFAIKILDKRQIIREKKVKYVTIEKQVLNKLNHQFVIKLFYTFQDVHSLYFVLEYAPNGDLLELLKSVGRMNMECCRFYIGQVIEAVEYLHENGILHRDIKPENVLLDERWYIKLADFGSSLILDSCDTTFNDKDVQDTKEECKEIKRKASFVGTAEYCCPELLNDRAISEKSDVWSLGVLLFQLLSGRHPFRGSTEYQTFQKILLLEYCFPMDMDDKSRDLLRNVFILESNNRYSLPQFKQDAFFESMNFQDLYSMSAPQVLVFNHSRGVSTSTFLFPLDDEEEELQQEDEEEEDQPDSLNECHLSNEFEFPKELMNIYPERLYYGLVSRVYSFLYHISKYTYHGPIEK